MWSNPIAVGESRTIGFTGIKNSESELSVDNYALSVVVIDTNGNNGGNDNPEPDIDLTTDTDGDKVPDAYEEVYGRIDEMIGEANESEDTSPTDGYNAPSRIL